MKDTKEAFLWIVGILRKKKIPFRLTGGLAAKVYGSPRDLADIDIDVIDDQIEEILPAVKERVVFGPARYKDKNWDLWMMTLRYLDQEIDICGSQLAKIFDKSQKKWIPYKADFSNSVIKKIFDRRAPVVPKGDLVSYKSKLRRKVDLADLKALNQEPD